MRPANATYRHPSQVNPIGNSTFLLIDTAALTSLGGKGFGDVY